MHLQVFKHKTQNIFIELYKWLTFICKKIIWSQQALVQKLYYLFDVQKNSIVMALGVT